MRLTEQQYHDHEDAYDGYCTTCGDWTCGGVEPDAEGYTCETCGEDTVDGTLTLLVEGRIEICT